MKARSNPSVFLILKRWRTWYLAQNNPLALRSLTRIASHSWKDDDLDVSLLGEKNMSSEGDSERNEHPNTQL